MRDLFGNPSKFHKNQKIIDENHNSCKQEINKKVNPIKTVAYYFSFISGRFLELTQDFNDRPNDEPTSTYENLETLIN